MADDVEVEAQWYDEFAGALETCAAECRRAAKLWRVAGGALSPAELADYRARLAGVIRRVIGEATLTTVLTGDPRGGKGGLT